MSGTLIAIAALIPIYFLIVVREPEIDRSRLIVALFIPLVVSALVAFSRPLIESAGIRGWLSVLVHLVVMYATLRKIVALPPARAAAYTVSSVVLETVLQSIWYYWLIDFF